MMIQSGTKKMDCVVIDIIGLRWANAPRHLHAGILGIHMPGACEIKGVGGQHAGHQWVPLWGPKAINKMQICD